jgi:hypothetical protein
MAGTTESQLDLYSSLPQQLLSERRADFCQIAGKVSIKSLSLEPTRVLKFITPNKRVGIQSGQF